MCLFFSFELKAYIPHSLSSFLQWQLCRLQFPMLKFTSILFLLHLYSINSVSLSACFVQLQFLFTFLLHSMWYLPMEDNMINSLQMEPSQSWGFSFLASSWTPPTCLQGLEVLLCAGPFHVRHGYCSLCSDLTMFSLSSEFWEDTKLLLVDGFPRTGTGNGPFRHMCWWILMSMGVSK